MKRRVLMAAGAALIVAVAALYFVGRELVSPRPEKIGAPPAGLDIEAISFASQSGSTISAWLSKPAQHRGTVLLLPGVRANRLSMVERARFLHDAGYATLLMDFQATGESPGDAITFGWRERLDVQAAVEAIRTRMPGESIGVIGMSLGGAATLLAMPALDVQAVVLEAVYPDIDVAVKNRLRIRLGSAGAALSPLLLMQLEPRLGVSPDRLRPVDHIQFLRCPLLVIAGTADQHTTVADTRRLYGAAHAPKDLWMIEGAAHVDFLRAAGDAYRDRVLKFFSRMS